MTTKILIHNCSKHTIYVLVNAILLLRTSNPQDSISLDDVAANALSIKKLPAHSDDSIPDPQLSYEDSVTESFSHYIKTGKRRFSDAEILHECVQISKTLPQKTIPPYSLPRLSYKDDEAFNLQAAVSEKVFTQEDYDYIKERYAGNAMAEKVNQMFTHIIRCAFYSSSPSPCLTSPGSKLTINHKMDLRKISGVKRIVEGFGRTDIISISTRKLIPDIELYYNEFDSRFVNYMTMLRDHPLELIGEIIRLQDKYLPEIGKTLRHISLESEREKYLKEKKMTRNDSLIK